MNKRYELRSEFAPNSADLAWAIIDTSTGLDIATVFVFDGTAQAIVDLCNQGPRDAQDELDKLYAEIEKAINESGTAIGNEHETYSLQQRIRDITTQRDYYQRQTDEGRQRIACARGLLEALKACVDYIESIDELPAALAKANDAITKAENL